jgi:hypothetical protein
LTPEVDGERYRLTKIAPSSIMQFVPITIGPAIAKRVAFGCTIVPAGMVKNVSKS